ncbi:1-phosphofructokinase family hexose kinase [Saccharopolyspora taberi]|uniref:1-phosphofructokinase family hexose kinase n=1 Tax=Saccharopolyspora taberi TaxID=60895 RepID=A0ABN3VBL4_9PSEU
MILTVTPNPAWDITYSVDALAPGRTHRVRHVAERAGGKGINVARVLHRLGHEVLVTAPLGGATGDLVRAGLAGLDHSIAPIRDSTRRTVSVVTDGDATLLNEPGPALTAEEWQGLRALVAARLDQVSVVVLSGSLPRGVSPADYADLVRSVPRPTIVDTSGEALAHAASAGPDIVKPNADELRDLTGCADPLRGATALRSQGAHAVVASLGPEGLLAVTAEGAFRAAPGREVRGNPTGAGDSVVAALAVGVAAGTPWPDRLRNAVALSAATVAAPVAGEFTRDEYEKQLAAVHLEEIPCPS